MPVMVIGACGCTGQLPFTLSQVLGATFPCPGCARILIADRHHAQHSPESVTARLYQA